MNRDSDGKAAPEFITTTKRVLRLLRRGNPRWHNLSELAREVGVSRQRVSQIVQRAGGREALGIIIRPPMPELRMLTAPPGIVQHRVAGKLPLNVRTRLAVELLCQGVTFKEVQRHTGYARNTVKEIRKKYVIRLCTGCGKARKLVNQYCAQCLHKYAQKQRRER